MIKTQNICLDDMRAGCPFCGSSLELENGIADPTVQDFWRYTCGSRFFCGNIDDITGGLYWQMDCSPVFFRFVSN